MIEEGLQALVGTRYYITPSFVHRVWKMDHLPVGTIVTVSHVQVQGTVVIDLKWPGAGVTVFLSDLALLVPVPCAD